MEREVVFHEEAAVLQPAEVANEAVFLAEVGDVVANFVLPFLLGDLDVLRGNAALAELAMMLKIPKEKIIAVGDNLNDTSMFLESGLSLCTSNGNEEAKRLADRVICSNDEGVADYILNTVIN